MAAPLLHRQHLLPIALLAVTVLVCPTSSRAQPLTLSETPEGDALALFYSKASLGIDDRPDVASWTVKAAEADIKQAASTSSVGGLSFEAINWHPQEEDTHMTVLPSWSQYDPEAACYVYRVEALDVEGKVIKKSNVVRSTACSSDGTVSGSRAHELLLNAGEEDDYVLPLGGADLDAYDGVEGEEYYSGHVTVAPEGSSGDGEMDEEQMQSLRGKQHQGEQTRTEVAEKTTAPAADEKEHTNDDHDAKDKDNMYPDCSPAEPFCGQMR